MQLDEKINSLKKIIFDQLSPLIDRDFVYLDLPYHDNIGDILIWEGTSSFIKQLPFQCKYSAAIETFKESKIKPKDIILLHGGGNFGDLWYKHQQFRLDIIEKYRDHRIIILPQTVYYRDNERLKENAATMADHPDLIICARDKPSQALLEKHFSNHTIILVPDMAFCIAPKQLSKWKVNRSEKTLFLKRTDKELSNSMQDSVVNTGTKPDICDWPSLEETPKETLRLLKIINSKHLSRGIADWYARTFFKKNLMHIGISFISSYQTIYTTRLHGAILAMLLNKSFFFLDNSYGKNSGFYTTWLKDVQEITFVE